MSLSTYFMCTSETADALNTSELHSFIELMGDYADVTGDNWYLDAFEPQRAGSRTGLSVR